MTHERFMEVLFPLLEMSPDPQPVPYPGPEDWSCTHCGAYNNWQWANCWKCGASKQ